MVVERTLSSAARSLLHFSLHFDEELATRYQKPEGVEVGGKFVVSVRGTSDREPLLICDESRTCNFEYEPSGPGHAEIWREVQKESAWDGKKTFMKASFDEEGECTIYPTTACVKNKYRW